MEGVIAGRVVGAKVIFENVGDMGNALEAQMICEEMGQKYVILPQKKAVKDLQKISDKLLMELVGQVEKAANVKLVEFVLAGN